LIFATLVSSPRNLFSNSIHQGRWFANQSTILYFMEDLSTPNNVMMSTKVFSSFLQCMTPKGNPNVKLKYSSHTTCNPKNSAYLCSTSHVEQNYATCLSKSFFLTEIMSVKIDDFRPNLVWATHIWLQGFIGSLRVRAK